MAGTEAVKVSRTSSGLKAVSRLNVTVSDDAQYVCRSSTDAGPADNLTSRVFVVTGTLALELLRIYVTWVTQR